MSRSTIARDGILRIARNTLWFPSSMGAGRPVEGHWCIAVTKTGKCIIVEPAASDESWEAANERFQALNIAWWAYIPRPPRMSADDLIKRIKPGDDHAELESILDRVLEMNARWQLAPIHPEAKRAIIRAKLKDRIIELGKLAEEAAEEWDDIERDKLRAHQDGIFEALELLEEHK